LIDNSWSPACRITDSQVLCTSDLAVSFTACERTIVAVSVILEPRVDVPVNCITLAVRLPGNQSAGVPREVRQPGEVLFKSCLKLVGEFTHLAPKNL
jgi:hypothetical protein